jgi:hypothetical protein
MLTKNALSYPLESAVSEVLQACANKRYLSIKASPTVSLDEEKLLVSGTVESNQ